MDHSDILSLIRKERCLARAAKQLGISRQRVHQIAKLYGINVYALRKSKPLLGIKTYTCAICRKEFESTFPKSTCSHECYIKLARKAYESRQEILEIIKGDKEWEALYAKLISCFNKWHLSYDIKEAAVNDAMLTALRDWKPGGQAISVYCYTLIARNLTNHFKRIKTRKEVDVEVASLDGETTGILDTLPDLTSTGVDARIDLSWLMSQLPTKWQVIINALVDNDLSQVRAAKQLGMSVQALNKVLVKIRKRFGDVI